MNKSLVILMVCMVVAFNCIDVKGFEQDTCVFHLEVPQYPKGRVTLEVCDWRCADIMSNAYGVCIADVCLCLPKGNEDTYKPKLSGKKDLGAKTTSTSKPEPTKAKESCLDEYGGYCDDKALCDCA